MGYGVRVMGRIVFDPPFKMTKLGEDRKYLTLDGSRGYEYRIKFEAGAYPVEVEGETFYGARIIGIVPADDARDFSAMNLEEDLQEMHDQAAEAGVTDFNGYIYAIGEESGDIERFWFDPHDGKLHTEHAVLSWPDGTPVAKEIYSL